VGNVDPPSGGQNPAVAADNSAGGAAAAAVPAADNPLANPPRDPVVPAGGNNAGGNDPPPQPPGQLAGSQHPHPQPGVPLAVGRAMYRLFNSLRSEIKDALADLPPPRDRLDDDNDSAVGAVDHSDAKHGRPPAPSLLNDIVQRLGGDDGQQSPGLDLSGPSAAIPPSSSSAAQPSLLPSAVRLPRSKPDTKADDGRLAVQLIHNARPYGSFVNFVKMVEWKQKRTQREAEHIAQSVDAYLNDGVSPLCDGMEIQLRRLAGIHLADETDDWEVCEAVQFTPTSKSLLPRLEVDRVIKSAVQRKRLMTAVGKSASSGGVDRSSSANWKRGGRKPPAQSHPQQSSASAPSKPTYAAPPKNKGSAVLVL